MISGLLQGAKNIFIGGKYHWKTILTGFGLYHLLKPKPRPDMQAQQALNAYRNAGR